MNIQQKNNKKKIISQINNTFDYFCNKNDVKTAGIMIDFLNGMLRSASLREHQYLHKTNSYTEAEYSAQLLADKQQRQYFVYIDPITDESYILRKQDLIYLPQHSGYSIVSPDITQQFSDEDWREHVERGKKTSIAMNKMLTIENNKKANKMNKLNEFKKIEANLMNNLAYVEELIENTGENNIEEETLSFYEDVLTQLAYVKNNIIREFQINTTDEHEHYDSELDKRQKQRVNLLNAILKERTQGNENSPEASMMKQMVADLDLEIKNLQV